MQNFSLKDYTFRNQVKNFELAQKILKSLLFNRLLTIIVRRKITWQFSRLTFLYSFSFLKNKCILSGRNRSVYRKFNLSRLQIKSLFKSSFIPYLQKSSW